MEEVEKHISKDSLWTIIKDNKEGDLPKVYDVTKYLDDHPGGSEVMLEQGGQDATDMFEDIGHSSEARETMKKYCIGVLKMSEEEKARMAEMVEKKKAAAAAKAAHGGGGLSFVTVAIMIIALVLGYYYSQQQQSA